MDGNQVFFKISLSLTTLRRFTPRLHQFLKTPTPKPKRIFAYTIILGVQGG
jgi:hypothetical protein